MKTSTNARRLMLSALLSGTTILATGCSSGGFSMASMNPFSASPASGSGPGAAASVTESIASTTSTARGQLASLGSNAKSAWGKTTGAVTGMFAKGDDVEAGSAPDPLRLDNKPNSISPEVFVANGQLWESTGDFTKAMESYVKALESEPNHPPALTSIARLHFRQGDHQKAAEFFQKAIMQSPEDAGLYNDLGLTLSKLGQHEAAAQTLQRALQLAPGTPRYANNLASVKFESGDASGAYEVLSAHNKAPVAHFNMAYLHFKKGQMNEARGHLGQAVQFESQAGEDVAVQRAVERSRDMLAQIEGSRGPIAQAAPQAQMASMSPNAKPTVQQASQSQAAGSSPHVAPASKVSTPAPSWTAPTPTLPAGSVTPTAPAASTSTPSTTTAPSVPFALPSGFGSGS